MIIRGTTPTMTFELPIETNIIATGFVVIKQNGVAMIEKEFSDCQCGEKMVSAKFTQEETLKLSAGKKAEINLVVKTLGGDRLESKSFFENVADTSKEGVI